MTEAKPSATAEKLSGQELRFEAQELLNKLNDALRPSSSFQATLLEEYLTNPSYLEQRRIRLVSGGFDFSVQYQSKQDRKSFKLVQSMNNIIIRSVRVTVPTEDYLQPASVVLFEGLALQQRCYRDTRYCVEAAAEMIKALPV